MKKFLSVKDVNSLQQLVNSAITCKQTPFDFKKLGQNKRLGCLFLNPSMRTRLSTQIAAQNLGMDCIVFNVGAEGWALEINENAVMNGTTVEHVKDAAPILGNYFDILAIRTFPTLTDREQDYSEQIINAFIKYAQIPVVSLESATLHPLQSLADIVSIQEDLLKTKKKKIKIVLSWAPHIKPLPQCVSNSFAQWVNAWKVNPTSFTGDELEIDFVITHPKGYELDEQFTNGATIEHNQEEALKDADYVYVKNWSSYHNYGKILCNDEAWMLTAEKMKLTANAKIMHCLPVRRNVELSAEVLDSQNSLVTQQGANRVWAAQAVLKHILSH